jgi:hypothetical protein
MRCLTPDVCAAVMAASLSFFACLQGLQRFGSFFKPLSWKKACSPEVQMKFSLQSTHLMVRSGCSGEESVSDALISSCLSDMISSPWIGVDSMILNVWRDHWDGFCHCQKRRPPFVLASIGVSVGLPSNRLRMGKSITMTKLCQG